MSAFDQIIQVKKCKKICEKFSNENMDMENNLEDNQSAGNSITSKIGYAIGEGVEYSIDVIGAACETVVCEAYEHVPGIT